MIDGLGSGSSGGGGVSSSMLAQMLAGYAQETWVDENYVSISYFNRLFQAFNGSTAVNPNDLTTAITNIKAMVDFWSAGAVSALGYGGGGGGVTLNEPLSSINSAALGTPSASGQTLVWNGTAWTYGSGGSGGASALSQLSDVQLSSPTNGQALVYNATSGKWENQTIGGGGGGGTLTSIGLVMPTGFAVSPATLTADGSFTVTFLENYRLLTREDEIIIQEGYTAYQWGDHSQAGYATQTWVQQQGYTSNAGTVTSVGMTVPTGFSLSGSPITSSGTLALSFASGYSLPLTADVTKGVTAYGWGDHAQAGYASASDVTTLQGYFTSGVAKEAAKLSTVSKTAWGQTYWTSGGVPTNISGNMTDVGNITTGNSGGLISGFQGIEMNTNGTLTTSGGYIDFHYNGSSSDFTSRIIEDASGRIQMNAQVYIPSAKSLRIGDGLLSWDSTNNALKVSLYDGSAANFYSLGAVSALGFQSGSGGTNSATIGTLAVTTQLNMTDGTRISTPQDLYIGNVDSEGWVFMADLCSQDGSNIWSIVNDPSYGGVAKFSGYVMSPKFYFDTSKYLYVSGYNLMFYDGQDSYKVKLEQA